MIILHKELVPQRPSDNNSVNHVRREDQCGTNSTEASYPVTVGPDLSDSGGFNDGFVAKISSRGLPFVDGFESGENWAWSATVPRQQGSAARVPDLRWWK